MNSNWSYRTKVEEPCQIGIIARPSLLNRKTDRVGHARECRASRVNVKDASTTIPARAGLVERAAGRDVPRFALVETRRLRAIRGLGRQDYRTGRLPIANYCKSALQRRDYGVMLRGPCAWRYRLNRWRCVANCSETPVGARRLWRTFHRRREQ